MTSIKKETAALPEMNGAAPQEPLFALTLSDMQSLQNFLQREIIAGRDAGVLLSKLAEAFPVQVEEA